METKRQKVVRRVVNQLSYSFYADEKVSSLFKRLFSHRPGIHLHRLRSVILLSCIIITIIPPSIGFGNSAFYYTANEGGSISKVDALSNTLIKSIPLEGVVHNAQISLAESHE